MSFSGLPPAIAAAIAAAPPSARPIGPQIALPPYIPAPNLGDPSEAIETVRVEKYEFTELVEKYAPLPVEPIAEIEEVPRAFDTRRVLPTVVRFAPLIGGVALVMAFVIGYLMFDGDRARMSTVKAPASAAGDDAKADPAKVDDVKADAAKTDDTNAAKADAAKGDAATADVAKGDAAKSEAAKADAAKADAAKADEIKAVKPNSASSSDAASKTVATGADSKPDAKPVRGKIWITSNKPAQIFLDGKSASATTPRQLVVRPGMHKVTLWETASGKTHTQMIEVQVDKVVAVSKKF